MEKQGGFLGHPRGLAVLAFSEAWERFSYYGMTSLLVLYMVHYLLLPQHVAHIAGFGPFKAAIEGVYGKLSPEALASAIYGLYAGFVYLTPIAGGFLADRVLGRTRTVTIGAILMAIGQFGMAFDATFLMALGCLLIGVGCFKGNIATQVGELYAPDDLRRADAFQIYMLGIQISVIVAPLVCGTLGEDVDWHLGFAAAGGGMLIGLAIYLWGARWLPPHQVRRSEAAGGEARSKLARKEITAVLVLLALLPALMLCALGNLEIFNAYLIWGEKSYKLVFFGETMPVTWLLSLDAFISTGLMAGVVVFWRWWAKRRPEPDEITKLLIGACIAAGAPAALAAASYFAAVTGQKVGLGWGLAFHVLNDLGFAMVFPIGLALFSRVAPRSIGGVMIGVYYLHLFLANMAVGYLGGLLEKMPGAQFWMLHAGLMVVGCIVLAVMRTAFRRTLSPVVAT
jgi:POT family proton-dependent oligopeptide transporter